MTIVLYRRRVSLTSGAGQLIRMQAEGLGAAGENVRVACRRGAFAFALRTRLPVTKIASHPPAASLLVDHQLEFPTADVVFVHNLMSEAARHVRRDDWMRQAAAEVRFFRALKPESPIVANSFLVQRGLIEHFNLDPERITVIYPGFRSGSFTPHYFEQRVAGDGAAHSAGGKATAVRLRARRSLGVVNDAPLIGFVTSGEFDKRGLDIFLASAERIAAARPDVNFLVVGAKRLPAEASRHRLVAEGRLKYRPKGFRPERWFSALDIFLFPARYEEFGMVISEAQASGLPVLTSRCVGAAECLPAIYDPWLLDTPDPEGFAASTLKLLDDHGVRLKLSAAGVAGIAAFDRTNYVRASVQLIRECAREKREAKNGSSGTR